MNEVRRYTGGGQPARPDFVLLGVPAAGGGVELWASTTLSYAELEAEFRHAMVDPDGWAGEFGQFPVLTSTSYTLRAGLARFTVSRAATYREALAQLLADPAWQPPGGAAAIAGPGG